MPSSDETLTMLREAFDLGLMPEGWGNVCTRSDGAVWVSHRGELGEAHQRLEDGEPSRAALLCYLGHVKLGPRELESLLDHLARRGLRCIYEPGEVPFWSVQAPWPEAEREMREWCDSPGGKGFCDTDCPGILGLLAAAIAAETWRRAREAGVRDAG